LRSAFADKFRHDRSYFAAVETKIAQRAVIELAKCVVGTLRPPAEITRLLEPPVVRERAACDCAGCADRSNDVLGEQVCSARCS